MCGRQETREGRRGEGEGQEGMKRRRRARGAVGWEVRLSWGPEGAPSRVPPDDIVFFKKEKN